MNIINRKTKMREPWLLRRSAVVLAGVALITLPATTIFAHTPDDEDIAKYEVEEQVSANSAKRLARAHLCSMGFCSRFGPGGAKIRSITRDAGTWIVYTAGTKPAAKAHLSEKYPSDFRFLSAYSQDS